jgi:hypothetical protein
MNIRWSGGISRPFLTLVAEAGVTIMFLTLGEIVSPIPWIGGQFGQYGYEKFLNPTALER